VVIEAPCLDCGESVRVTVRDGVIEGEEPKGIYAYVDIPISEWSKNRPYS
jgi:hypothetical protein